MNKEIFIAVCDRLKTEVPGLRWIDAEEGQLNTGERPAVAFPCCLIDISYPSCETHMGGRQKITSTAFGGERQSVSFSEPRN